MILKNTKGHHAFQKYKLYNWWDFSSVRWLFVSGSSYLNVYDNWGCDSRRKNTI